MSTPKPASARGRSLGGCFTCRKRHIKCDESRPTCLVCKHYGVACGGYKARIAFDVDDLDSADTLRRPLYSPSEQKHLSDELASSVPLRKLQKYLAQIDESRPDEETTFLGPFAVFRACQASQEVTLDTTWSGGDSAIDLVEEYNTLDLCDNAAALTSSEALDVLFPDMFLDPSATEYGSTLFEDPSLFMSLPEVPFFSFESNDCQESQSNALVPLRVHSPWQSPAAYVAPSSQSRLPVDAPFLLSNYRDTVIGYLSPLHRHKTSWHMLYVPSAMITVAALTLGDSPGHAKLTILYAMLSISAFCLRGEAAESMTRFWEVKANDLKARAQHHLTAALEQLSDTTKRATYKEIVMALLTMAIASLFAGQTAQAPLYLHDADKFIRVRGLRKSPKSRKVRLLHHQYSFIRLFHESTVLHKTSTAAPQGLLSKDNMDDTRSVDARKGHPLRLYHTKKSLDQQMLEHKSRERGENDLCLQHPGAWESSLYPEIFGIPESWLVLLSQTIRLGNERDISNIGSNERALDWQDFSGRARVLEQCILLWQRPNLREQEEQCRYVDDDPEDNICELMEAMLSGLHEALQIYFYRRVANVDASVLQNQVSAIRRYLEKCKVHRDDRLKYCAGFLWTAWIAACEALGPEDQEFFVRWFGSLEQSKFPTALSAVAVMKHVWQQRRERNDHSFTWCQYVRDHSVNLVFF